MPDLSLDWLLFLLRLAFIVVLYLFLYQVVRITFKDLISRAEQPASAPAPPGSPPARTVAPNAVFTISDPGSTGLSAGFDWPVFGGATIGRHPSNDITLDDPSVSGEHAQIGFERTRWVVRDLGSTNGTLVNGSRIDGPTTLRSGDDVRVGRVSGRFQA